MQSANDIQSYLDDLAALFPGELAGTGIVVVAQDLTAFAKSFSDSLPYLIGVLADTSFSGSADSIMCSDYMEFFLAYHVSPKTAYKTLLDQTDTLKDMARRIMLHVCECKSKSGLWYGLQIDRTAVVQLSIQQMRGYALQFSIRTPL